MTQIFDHLVLQGYDRQVLRREQEKEKRIEVASEIRRTRRRSTTVVLEYQIRFEEGQDRVSRFPTGVVTISGWWSYTGWWFGTWLFFLHILGIIIPTDTYFSEGLKPPTSIFSWVVPVMKAPAIALAPWRDSRGQRDWKIYSKTRVLSLVRSYSCSSCTSHILQQACTDTQFRIFRKVPLPQPPVP